MIGTYMQQACTVTAPGAAGKLGGATAGTPVATLCRFLRRSKHVTGPDGKIVLSTGLVTLPSTVDVAAGYVVTFAGTSYRVLSVADVASPWGAVQAREAVLV